MTARVREDLEREAEDQAESAVRSQLVDSLLEANPFQVPRSMAERYMDSVLGDTSKLDPEVVAETKEKLRPEAEKAVKTNPPGRSGRRAPGAESHGGRGRRSGSGDRRQERRSTGPGLREPSESRKPGGPGAGDHRKKVFDFLKAESTVNQDTKRRNRGRDAHFSTVCHRAHQPG